MNGEPPFLPLGNRQCDLALNMSMHESNVLSQEVVKQSLEGCELHFELGGFQKRFFAISVFDGDNTECDLVPGHAAAIQLLVDLPWLSGMFEISMSALFALN